MSFLPVALVFLEGLLAFVSPCVLPMLPIYFFYLSGQSSRQQLDQKGPSEDSATTKKRSGAFLNTLFFVLGFTIVFVILGATATTFGRLMAQHQLLLERIAGVVVIIFGIHMTGLVRLPFLAKERRLPFVMKGKGALSAWLFGMAFSIGWSPCLGPFLGAAMLKATSYSSVYEGMFLLFVFAMGLAVPFILTSLLFDQLTGLFQWLKKHLGKIKIISGVFLILVGLVMLLGLFGYYTALFL